MAQLYGKSTIKNNNNNISNTNNTEYNDNSGNYNKAKDKCRSRLNSLSWAPTSVHGPTSEKCCILVDTPTLTSCMFPWDLEDLCWLISLGKRGRNTFKITRQFQSLLCGLPGPASWLRGISQTESAPPAMAAASDDHRAACCFSTCSPTMDSLTDNTANPPVP